MPSSVPTLMPPADSPKIVTSSGLPPNASMLSRTHSSAATWSRIPALPEPRELLAEDVVEVEEAERAEPVVDGHDHDVAVLREPGAVVDRRRTGAVHERAAVDPEHHRALGVVERRAS